MMKMRLIDADALKAYLDAQKGRPFIGCTVGEALKIMTDEQPTIQPRRGKWILDRSGAYCCSECMEPCAGYVMMKPRDKFCKMCGSRNEVTE